MKITITLECESETEAHSVTERLLGIPGKDVSKIPDPLNDPSFGKDVMAVRQGATLVSVPLPPQAAVAVAVATSPDLAAVGFGQGVTLPAGATPAPASAAAAPSATVPAVPSGTTAVPPVPTAPAQPPAAAAGAPQVPAVPPASVPGAVTFDKDGLPWDARIHAGTKTFNKDGTWRQKRELDPAVRTAVEAELRHVMALNAAAAPAAQSAVPLPPTVPTVAVPQPSTPAQATPEVSGASPSEPLTFATLFEKVTPLMMENKITPAQVGEALKSVGLTAIGQLAMAPHLVPQVAAALGVA